MIALRCCGTWTQTARPRPPSARRRRRAPPPLAPCPPRAAPSAPLWRSGGLDLSLCLSLVTAAPSERRTRSRPSTGSGQLLRVLVLDPSAIAAAAVTALRAKCCITADVVRYSGNLVSFPPLLSSTTALAPSKGDKILFAHGHISIGGGGERDLDGKEVLSWLLGTAPRRAMMMQCVGTSTLYNCDTRHAAVCEDLQECQTSQLLSYVIDSSCTRSTVKHPYSEPPNESSSSPAAARHTRKTLIHLSAALLLLKSTPRVGGAKPTLCMCMAACCLGTPSGVLLWNLEVLLA
ncbi:hypothetical protein BC834DRAFT_358106 [Gloeopeniophorella convolvens]|nr:hypothetical protein BC834DRAFT_358106 [Gloeopeniophorella convolvens]